MRCARNGKLRARRATWDRDQPRFVAGLGAERGADVIRLLWPTGVLQDEMQIPAYKDETITEIDRRGSSCPIVFVWNGDKFEFLADMIGPGIVGHWTGPEPAQYSGLQTNT